MSALKSSALLGTLILLLGNLSSQVQAIGFPQPNVVIARSGPASGQSKPIEPSLCPEHLSDSIRKIIDQPNLRRSRWGIQVQTLESEDILYQLNGDQFFTPASNVKLLTTAAVLQRLGTDFRVRTPVYATGSAPNLKTLTLVGRGDPSLTTEKLQILVEQLKQLGIKKTEKLIVEDSYFKAPTVNPTWEWEDLLFYYAAPVSSLIINENAVTLTLSPQVMHQSLAVEWSDPIAAKQWQIKNEASAAPQGTPYNISITAKPWQSQLVIEGSLGIKSAPDTFGIAIPAPERYFLETLEQLLIQAGIGVDETILSTKKRSYASRRPITMLESDTIGKLIQKVNQDSNNLYAEALRQILIAEISEGVEDKPFSQPLSELGVDATSYQLIDGSGLSRRNFVSPASLVQLLISMSQTPISQVYRDSLAISGLSGTLKNRFRDSEIANHFVGKTGTLTGVSALSGYLTPKAFPTLAVSIMVNQSNQPASVLRDAIDQIIQRIYYLDLLSSC